MIQSFQLPSTSNNPKESIHGVNESLLARQPTSWCKDLLGKFDTLRKKTSIKERARKIKKKIRKKYPLLNTNLCSSRRMTQPGILQRKILASNIPRPSILLFGDGYRARKRRVRRKHARAWPTCSLETTNAANTNAAGCGPGQGNVIPVVNRCLPRTRERCTPPPRNTDSRQLDRCPR